MHNVLNKLTQSNVDVFHLTAEYCLSLYIILCNVDIVVKFCENSNAKKIIKSTNVYLFTIMVAKRCSFSKHFMVTADENVCKHYFYMHS